MRSAMVSILDNGVHTTLVTMNRGSQQDEPLSPYQFVLTMETFTELYEDANKKDII